jgi:hypothetical protein
VKAGATRKPLDFAFFQRQKITKPATWSEIEGEYYVHSTAATQHWAKVASEPVVKPKERKKLLVLGCVGFAAATPVEDTIQ